MSTHVRSSISKACLHETTLLFPGSLESTFGSYGMPLFIGVSALAFCLLCIVICLCIVLRRRKGRKDFTKGEKSIPTLKMLEVGSHKQNKHIPVTRFLCRCAN